MANIRTINTSQKVIEKLIPTLDSSGYFLLGKSDLSRLELFDFAFALGCNRGYPTKVEGKKSLIRQEGIGNEKYLYMSVYFKEKVKGDDSKIDQITEDSNIYVLAEEFAETGFSVINDTMKNSSAETFCLSLLTEMEEMYEKIKSDMNLDK